MRDWMRNRRLELRQTQQNIAAKAGTSREYYARLELGSKGTNLSALLLKGISEALEIDLDEAMQAEFTYSMQQQKTG